MVSPYNEMLFRHKRNEALSCATVWVSLKNTTLRYKSKERRNRDRNETRLRQAKAAHHKSPRGEGCLGGSVREASASSPAQDLRVLAWSPPLCLEGDAESVLSVEHSLSKINQSRRSIRNTQPPPFIKDGHKRQIHSDRKQVSGGQGGTTSKYRIFFWEDDNTWE